MHQDDPGGNKKFLYSSPNSNAKGKNPDGSDADPWSFPAKPTNDIPKGLKLDLDDVWSIRNVGLGPSARSVLSDASTVKSEILTKNASTAFYSRHGGMKGRASPQGGAPNDMSSDPRSSGTNWASSGRSLAAGSRLGGPGPAPFQSPTEKAFRGRATHSRRFQNPSPFDHDLNDF
ncbi:hypothetical protein ElyMa_007069100 [Elysia marginata]|uniref:Uncharacterized protein n=1 Tax=Elysia marginata TaxID=1093978 RepID=A0AAV4JY18_9GAST|nr:hypothetical protein ElyMa_007069100 [Elysia marginata]